VRGVVVVMDPPSSPPIGIGKSTVQYMK
jgi:hypothetical protein